MHGRTEGFRHVLPTCEARDPRASSSTYSVPDGRHVNDRLRTNDDRPLAPLMPGLPSAFVPDPSTEGR
jgi:hypothetical protein